MMAQSFFDDLSSNPEKLLKDAENALRSFGDVSNEKSLKNKAIGFLFGRISILRQMGSSAAIKVKKDAMAQSFLNYANDNPQDWDEPMYMTSNLG